MTIKLNLFIALALLAALLAGATGLPPAASSNETVYIESSLWSSEAEILPVIVTAADSAAAARSVERVGGQVQSDLWLIDAVSAALPGDQLAALAAEPGLISIVRNKGVGPAGDPPDRDGWVTDRREKKALFEMDGGTVHTPPVFLPDGGFVAVAGNGTVVIGNADGSERARLELSGSGFELAPTVGPDGTIHLPQQSADKKLYALNPDGTIRWTFTNTEKFKTSPVFSPDGSFYIVDVDKNLIALDPANGQELWRYEVAPDIGGSVKF
jgi:outer membrane protein assembly factor BamB